MVPVRSKVSTAEFYNPSGTQSVGATGAGRIGVRAVPTMKKDISLNKAVSGAKVETGLRPADSDDKRGSEGEQRRTSAQSQRRRITIDI